MCGCADAESCQLPHILTSWKLSNSEIQFQAGNSSFERKIKKPLLHHGISFHRFAEAGDLIALLALCTQTEKI